MHHIHQQLPGAARQRCRHIVQFLIGAAHGLQRNAGNACAAAHGAPHQAFQPQPALGELVAGLGAHEERDAGQRARELLERVGLADQADEFAKNLPYGAQRRLEIARALATQPRLLLLDEPFGALDAFTREQMQTLLLRLWHEHRRQVLLITHDIEEAIFMATDLVLLSPSPGRVTERLTLDFGRRFAAGEPCRSIKSDPAFIERREYVLERVFAEREAFA